jgi:hypothetical protein
VLELGAEDAEGNGLGAACSLFHEPDDVGRRGGSWGLGSAGELRAVPVSVGVWNGEALSPQKECVLSIASIKEWYAALT